MNIIQLDVSDIPHGHGMSFKKGVADSKFSDYAGFGQIPEGHILLQDHGHSVVFKNIKIRKITP